MERSINEMMEVCRLAARAGGAQLTQWLGSTTVRFKGPADLVTEADMAAERAICRVIAENYPGDAVLSEESGRSAASECGGDTAVAAEQIDHTASSSDGQANVLWIIDPLDGTTNFAHGMRPFAVSIAGLINGRAEVAVVFDPISQEWFEAQRGCGARLNGRSIEVSGCTELKDALVGFSLPSRVRRDSDEVSHLLSVLGRVQSTRRTGSSALNLCYVACGRLDAFWSTNVRAWDVAAGALILAEAGAVLRAFDGGLLDLDHPRLLAASTEALWQALHRLLSP